MSNYPVTCGCKMVMISGETNEEFIEKVKKKGITKGSPKTKSIV